MLLGIIPLMITIYWMVFSFVTTDYNHKADVADLVMVLGEVVFGYVFAFVVSGTAALWSARVEKRTPGISVIATKSTRILVAVVLVVPLVIKAL